MYEEYEPYEPYENDLENFEQRMVDEDMAAERRHYEAEQEAEAEAYAESDFEEYTDQDDIYPEDAYYLDDDPPYMADERYDSDLWNEY